MLVGSENHPGVADPVVLVLLVSVLGQVALVLVSLAVVLFIKNVQLLGVVVGKPALLQSFPHVLVVLVVQSDVLRQLHDPLDSVDLVLHHDLNLGSHPLDHVEPVDLLHSEVGVAVVSLAKFIFICIYLFIFID